MLGAFSAAVAVNAINIAMQTAVTRETTWFGATRCVHFFTIVLSLDPSEEVQRASAVTYLVMMNTHLSEHS